MTHQKQNPAPLRTGTGLKGSRGTTDKDYSTSDPLGKILACLDGVKETGQGQYIAHCSAHDDRSPSLSIKKIDDRVLIHCFAGCETEAILHSLNLSLTDLFDRPLSHHKAPVSNYQRKRYGQAQDALKSVKHEIGVAYVLAEQMRSGFALDPSELQRLKTCLNRLQVAERMAA